MSGKRISICMASYNGARFIRQQLESLANQIRRPDELVICDDRSTDDTAQIVQRFANTATFPIRLYVNDQTLGVRLNFEKAIELSTGDIIFLCDQDDIWDDSKLARFEQVFADAPAVGLAFCDANVVDETATPLGYTFWQRLGFNETQQAEFDHGHAFDVFLRHCFVAGATLAFRSALRPVLLPLGEKWHYDAWIATVLSALAETRLVRQPMNQYRQHATQTIGGGRRKGFWQTYLDARRKVDAAFFAARAAEFEELRNRLLGAAAMQSDNRIIRRIGSKIALCLARAKMRQNPWLRWPLVARELLAGQYHQYAHGWRTAVLDLFV